MIRIQRLRVSDIVHSFCFVCRTGARDWPFLLLTPMYHAPFEARYFRNTGQYSLFVAFAQQYTVSFNRFCSVMRQLEMYTNQWDAAAFEYADELLVKYHGMGT